ncbi:MAG: hypothetical protein WKF94_02020 [Solirubrobacteraceae bacterium]
MHDHDADDLLRRALLEPGASAAVALRVGNLPLSDSVTVVFHGRRDLTSIQTYVALGRHGTGAALSADELLRVPCDLDLGDAEDREDAERLYAEQACAMRDALAAADTVLAIWKEPLEDLAQAHVEVDTRIALGLDLPAHRLLPTALVAAERQMVVAPVCEARTLAEGLPPLGIACIQQDVARVYPLPDDPETCLEDFLGRAADHAHRMADALQRQEASVARFLEISDFDETP